MFLLSFYLCGINLKDLLSVDLSVDILSFERIKTVHARTGKSVITIPIHSEAKAIISKYIIKVKGFWIWGILIPILICKSISTQL